MIVLVYEKTTIILAKVFAFLNGICVLFLFGGVTGFGKSGGILDSESIWKYYFLIISILLILGIGGIILGLIIKINSYEKPQEIQRTREYKSLSNMLLVTSPFILLMTFAFLWFAKFASF